MSARVEMGRSLPHDEPDASDPLVVLLLDGLQRVETLDEERALVVRFVRAAYLRGWQEALLTVDAAIFGIKFADHAREPWHHLLCRYTEPAAESEA